jgi:hypothetical protein
MAFPILHVPLIRFTPALARTTTMSIAIIMIIVIASSVAASRKAILVVSRAAAAFRKLGRTLHPVEARDMRIVAEVIVLPPTTFFERIWKLVA